MDVEITKKDGQTFLLSDYGFYARDFIVSSISTKPNYGDVEGRSGYIDYGSVYKERDISIPFWFKAKDNHDFSLARDELFSLVNSTDSFFIRELRLSNDTDVYVGGKRYLVRLNDRFVIDQVHLPSFGELVFETTELPFAESIGTSADIDRNGILHSQELWSYGMGLLHDEESHKYTHDTNTFSIYNPGNVAIHPFEQHLKITIDNAPGQVTLRNNTTGDEFKYIENLNDRKLVLDGPNITVNSLQALRDTNKKFITLAPGWNEFTSTGGAKVNFDFRFYYL